MEGQKGKSDALHSAHLSRIYYKYTTKIKTLHHTERLVTSPVCTVSEPEAAIALDTVSNTYEQSGHNATQRDTMREHSIIHKDT